MPERPVEPESDWSARRRAWEAGPVERATGRSPERRERFSTISDVEIERVYAPWSWGSDAADGPVGPGGPTQVDHHGNPLPPGGWDDFDPLRVGDDPRIPVLTVPAGALERQLARLERTRRERDGGAVVAALAGLRDAASRPESSAANLMPHFIRCAAAYATLGEQCQVLRDVFGAYRASVGV
jgi:hypothetical protein